MIVFVSILGSKMNFLFVNTDELSALMDIPLNQRVVYLMGMRPYMDRKTFIVGVRRKISYQSLRETLYVAPIAGVKTGSPSHQQMKRAVKSLARAGLIEIRSNTKNLIVKCLLADTKLPVQTENETPSPQTQTIAKPYSKTLKPKTLNNAASAFGRSESRKIEPQNHTNTTLRDLYQKFERFWHNYPLPSYKSNAWEEFQKINPDEELFEQIMLSLQQQSRPIKGAAPNWPYPADWLIQMCWRSH